MESEVGQLLVGGKGKGVAEDAVLLQALIRGVGERKAGRGAAALVDAFVAFQLSMKGSMSFDFIDQFSR